MKDPKGKLCPCGKPAKKWKFNGWCCAKCDEKEKIQYWDRDQEEKYKLRMYKGLGFSS